MKKKILSLALALLMAGSSASMIAADEAVATAADESAYASAVEFLHTYGIYKGDGESLAVEEEIERYEMALFVARISTGWTDDDKWEDGPQDTSGFTDINDGEEASAFLGAISYASQKGIIEGYGNGEFGPYDGITYQDALTMAVRTLGFTGLEWPWGYVEKAVELGLTTGIEDVAYTDILTRGEVAMVIYNTLFATKNGGSTLAHDIFGMSAWTPIVITASDLAVYEKGGTTLSNDGSFMKEDTFVTFKVFDPATGMIADNAVYYVKASDLGLNAAKHEDDLAVGSTYWVVFQQDDKGNYVEILEYEDTVIDELWNKGKTDDEGNAATYAVDAYLSTKTPVTKYSPANFVNSTKYVKPEIMLYSAIDQYFVELEPKIADANRTSLLAVDMETGDILVMIDKDAKAYDYKDEQGYKYNVLWYWNETVGNYFNYVKDSTGGVIGLDWMEDGEFNASAYINWERDASGKIVYSAVNYRGMNIMRALPGASAYASLVLEDVDGDNEAERGFYENYGFGKMSAAGDGTYNVHPATANMDANGTIYGGGNVGAAWFKEGFELKADGYVIYNRDLETNEVKVVKHILDRADETRTDVDSYVDRGVLRGYSTKQGKLLIGDETYTTSYAELLNNGFAGSASLAFGLEEMLNQYVEFVVVDGEVVAMNLTGIAADSAYLLVKNYAGLTNDGYIAVEAYNLKTGKLGMYCIASYNGWHQGDYYYYLNEAEVREAFATGTMYFVKSYDKNEDVYNVEVVGSYTANAATNDWTYTVDGDLGFTATTITFAVGGNLDGYKNVGGAVSLMSASDTYIIVPKKVNGAAPGTVVAPIYYHKGKVVDPTWTVTGQRITNIGDAIVLVDATNIIGFNKDAYQTGMYLYEGGKVVEAAYDSYYDQIFTSEFIEGRYLMGAVTYKVEALNLYTGVREDIIVDRNIATLTKGSIYTTVSGKLALEVAPMDNVDDIVNLMSNVFYTDSYKDNSYVTPEDSRTADYLFGTGHIYGVTRADNAAEKLNYANLNAALVADGHFNVQRDRVTADIFVPMSFTGVTYDAAGNVATSTANVLDGFYNYDAFINAAANLNINSFAYSYVYEVATGKMIVYASEFARSVPFTTEIVLASNVNNVTGVDLKASVTGVHVYDEQGLYVNSTVNEVNFYFTGANQMRHGDIAANGLTFGHLSDHENGSGLINTCGLYLVKGTEAAPRPDMKVDLFTKGTNNYAVEYTTWACKEGLCDLINGISFDLEAAPITLKDAILELNLTVNSNGGLEQTATYVLAVEVATTADATGNDVPTVRKSGWATHNVINSIGAFVAHNPDAEQEDAVIVH